MNKEKWLIKMKGKSMSINKKTNKYTLEENIAEFNYRIQKRYVSYMVGLLLLVCIQFSSAIVSQFKTGQWIVLSVCFALDYLILRRHTSILYGERLSLVQKLQFIMNSVFTGILVFFCLV